MRLIRPILLGKWTTGVLVEGRVTARRSTKRRFLPTLILRKRIGLQSQILQRTGWNGVRNYSERLITDADLQG